MKKEQTLCNRKFSNGHIEEWVNKRPKKNHHLTFTPVSIVLSIDNDLVLNDNNGYEICFNTGLLEGSGISVNKKGNVITFKEGSYKFDITGSASSSVDAKLIYDSDKFTNNIKSFAITDVIVNNDKLELKGIPTILPLYNKQSVIVKLIPNSDKPIVVNKGTRLLIHRVA